MKIFSKEQIREADKATISKEEIPSINLMERAGGYAFEYIHKRLNGSPVAVKVFCGIGNNGGDGLVIARNLLEQGYHVETYIVNYSDKRSDDFLKALEGLKSKAKSKDWPVLLKSEKDFPELDPRDLLIDAIFGIGYNRPADDWVQKLFQKINQSGAYVLSVDIASGLYMDQVPSAEETPVKPVMLLTFQAPKLIFFLPQTGKYIGNWDVLDIGLDREHLNKTATQAQLIDKPEAQLMYRPREKFSHKGTYGHSLLIAGSYGKMGAAVICSRACLTAGSGLVTAYVPQLGVDILQTALPEAMVIADRQNGKYLESFDFDLQPDVIGIGPGIGTADATVAAFKKFLSSNKTPMVLDADALNILAKNKEMLELLPAKSILTPHPGELQRLIGEWKDDFDKLEKTSDFAKKHDCIVVLKDAHTLVIYDEKYYVNNTGNPGMATAGSGDALTGIITGLIAQKYELLTAAIFGVYLHGKAGDIAVSKTGYEGLTSGILIDHLGQAFANLFQGPEEQQG